MNTMERLCFCFAKSTALVVLLLASTIITVTEAAMIMRFGGSIKEALPFAYTVDPARGGTSMNSIVTATGTLSGATGTLTVQVDGASFNMWTVDASNNIDVTARASNIAADSRGWGMVAGSIGFTQLLTLTFDLSGVVLPENTGLRITALTIDASSAPRYIVEGQTNVILPGGTSFALQTDLPLNGPDVTIGLSNGPYRLQTLTIETYDIDVVIPDALEELELDFGINTAFPPIPFSFQINSPKLAPAVGSIRISFDAAGDIPAWSIDASSVVTINQRADNLHQWSDGYGVIFGRIGETQLLLVSFDLENLVVPAGFGVRVSGFSIRTNSDENVNPRYIVDGQSNTLLELGNGPFTVDTPIEEGPSNTQIGFTDGPYNLKTLKLQTYPLPTSGGSEMSLLFGTTNGYFSLPFSFNVNNLDSSANGSDDFNIISTGSLEPLTGSIRITVDGSSFTPNWSVDASHVITINTRAEEIHSWFDGWGVIFGRIGSTQLLTLEIDVSNVGLSPSMGLRISGFTVTTSNDEDVSPRYIIDGVANVKLGAGNGFFLVDIPLESHSGNTRIGFTDGAYNLQSLTFQTYTIEDAPTVNPTEMPTAAPTISMMPSVSPSMSAMPTTTMGPTARTNLSGTRPNVILFLGDDQTIYDHGAYGNTKTPTSITSAFAKEALVFEKAFTGQTLCAPSRSMLYTGRYPVRNGCFLNHRPIREGIKTLPSYLQELGYKVVLAGKSHVNPASQFPWDFQWDTVFVNGKPRNALPFDMVETFLANPGPDPFVLILASEYPHGPYSQTTNYTQADVALWPYLEQWMRDQYPRYYANIIEKELEFERVLQLLDQNGMSDDAVVIYTDDHGAAGAKFRTYDRGTNVAFMVRWPGKVTPGRTDQLVSFADFVPTLIDLAGGSIPCGLDGKSMLPLWVDANAVSHEYLFAVSHRQGIRYNRALYAQRSVHDGRYHYVFNFNSEERNDREGITDYFAVRGAQAGEFYDEELLFDTGADKYELTNIADDPAMLGIKERLKFQLFKWIDDQNDILEENVPIPYLQSNHRLDQEDEKSGYVLPPEQIGVLSGQFLDSHQMSNPNAWLDPRSSYAMWIAENDVFKSMYQDEDSDGTINLYEFALGGDPTNKTDGGLEPSATFTRLTRKFQEVEVIHLRRKDALDELIYTIEVSADEVVWTTIPSEDVTAESVGAYSANYDLVTTTFTTRRRPTPAPAYARINIQYIDGPTIAPTSNPTTSRSTATPTEITSAPTMIPTPEPTIAPTYGPTAIPTVVATTAPTNSTLDDASTITPTTMPTMLPTTIPTFIPTTMPTTMPVN